MAHLRVLCVMASSWIGKAVKPESFLPARTPRRPTRADALASKDRMAMIAERMRAQTASQ